MTAHARTHALLLILASVGLTLSACRSVIVEHVSPEFKKTGLRGKTLALGEVLSARPQNDPTPFETAATLVASEGWLKEERPSTRVVSYVSFGQQMGALKTRFHQAGALPVGAMTARQYQKAQAAGVDLVLFVEMLDRDSRSGTSICKKEETTTEKDSDGQEKETTSTQEYYVSYATCWVKCRYSVVDVRTRQVVWQVSGTGSSSETKEGAQLGLGYVPMPEIPAMPPTTEAVRTLVPLALRKLPK